ncbi:helix-turn-helix transcriptional regulator [Clostridium cadaveris]|uniref:helix-turn-helix domain-containing protein n=1 Tax=Clostridium cadaveris TaxID=1529 RepID=UPI001459D9BF|nr:helix-turn-helix transcriptional regulator [Clostridium cadaveris]
MPLSKEEIGALIKKARDLKAKKIGRKFTQSDLAESLNKSRSYIGDIENGRTYPNYRLLAEIANVCEVPLSFFDESNAMLLSIISKTFKDMNYEDQEEFARYISNIMNSNNSEIIDWDIDTWKRVFEDYKMNLIAEESILESNLDDYEFKTPEAAMKFILKQPAIMGYGGFDVEKLSDEELIDFANELLNQMKLISYKYKK